MSDLYLDLIILKNESGIISESVNFNHTKIDKKDYKVLNLLFKILVCEKSVISKIAAEDSFQIKNKLKVISKSKSLKTFSKYLQDEFFYKEIFRILDKELNNSKEKLYQITGKLISSNSNSNFDRSILSNINKSLSNSISAINSLLEEIKKWCK